MLVSLIRQIKTISNLALSQISGITIVDFDKIATTTMPLKLKYCANIIPPTTDVTLLEIYTLLNLFGEYLKRLKIDADTFDYERSLQDSTLHLITSKLT